MVPGDLSELPKRALGKHATPTYINPVCRSQAAWYDRAMNTYLTSVLDSARQLPDAEQEALAKEIEDMIIRRKIAVAEADIAAGRVLPLADAFDQLEKRYGG